MTSKLDPNLNVGFLLHDVSRLLRALFDDRAQDFGLTRAQWRVLVHLAVREGLKQRELAEILEIDNVTLGRHIDRLERDGWLERQPDPADRRAWLLYLTERARPTLSEMEDLAVRTQGDAMRGLTDVEREAMVRMLLKMKDNIGEARVMEATD